MAPQQREPSYLALYRSGELARRTAKAVQLLGRCHLCPRVCRADRLRGERGDCRAGRRATVYSFHPHFGEEAPLVGRGGSGTIFFSHCNLECLFCQNWEISHLGQGEEVAAEALADMMLHLQASGCHNVNLVSPSHVVAQILEALFVAAGRGLRLPLVYNSGGYDALPALRLLDGVVDIYMPDMKYADAAVAQEFSGVRSYPPVNRAALKEMHRQVGDLVLDDRGVAVRGLLVRHLVLPHGLAGTAEVVRFLAEQISPRTYLNVMAQYHPCYRAVGHPLLGRRLTAAEYEAALAATMICGMQRLDRPFLR